MRAAGERVAGEEQGDIGEGGLGVQIRAVQCQAVSGAAGETLEQAALPLGHCLLLGADKGADRAAAHGERHVALIAERDEPAERGARKELRRLARDLGAEATMLGIIPLQETERENGDAPARKKRKE